MIGTGRPAARDLYAVLCNLKMFCAELLSWYHWLVAVAAGSFRKVRLYSPRLILLLAYAARLEQAFHAMHLPTGRLPSAPWAKPHTLELLS